jgi:hypothetical protein
MKKFTWISAVIMALMLTVSYSTTTFAATPVPSVTKTYILDLSVGAVTDCIDIYYNGSTWSKDYPEPYLATGYGKVSEQRWGNGFRFSNVNIPQNATITSAIVTFTAYRDFSNTTVNTRIVGNKEVDAGPFTTYDDYAGRRGTDAGGANNSKRTTAQLSWDNIAPWITDNMYQSPDISTIVQEIINQPDWVSGNHLALFWDDHEGRSSVTLNAARSAYSYYGSSSKCPRLHIEYTIKSDSHRGNGRAIGKEEAPGQNKMPGERAIGKAIGKEEAPGQNKTDGEHAIGKAIGKEEAPGQSNIPGERVNGKVIGKEEAPGQNK